MAHSEARLFPALLRHWRTRRGLSQLDLALAADVSPRHVSFLETGRAQPSREMVLRLGAALGVRLRDQNDMLRAAGFPDQFSEPRLEDGLPPGVAQAIERMLAQHEPFPMVLFDRNYQILRTNADAHAAVPAQRPEARVPHHAHRVQRAAERDARRALHRKLLPRRRRDSGGMQGNEVINGSRPPLYCHAMFGNTGE